MVKHLSFLTVLGLMAAPLGCGKAEVQECKAPDGEAYLCPQRMECAPDGAPLGCYDKSQLPEECKSAPAIKNGSRALKRLAPNTCIEAPISQ